MPTAQLLKRSAHLTDKLSLGTATPHDKETMPAVYDELENRQTEDKKISGGMLPTAEVRRSPAAPPACCARLHCHSSENRLLHGQLQPGAAKQFNGR